ncbi:unnamed protein product [Vitrella brassicaformis CCMP3155]|uniref:Uncharacterized protein n=1 Tax=Vitrella brassicaformis (strain CCMP3155) TaxID=1169540 RepID=A0A0G4EE11_VITBC|nr:unnamed protein product [Vitrella brassicaformis CCMP3155]|eukprot:CEL93803.1 unnamed protein product [Vitrella brassicaformis CCMP3155]
MGTAYSTAILTVLARGVKSSSISGSVEMEVLISGFRDSLESRHLLQKILRCLEDARDQSRVNGVRKGR